MSLRVDRMLTPPVPGRKYRVRCVNWLHPETGKLYWLPVIGAPHTDKQIGSIASCGHVHFDWRFIPISLLRECFGLDHSMRERHLRPYDTNWYNLLVVVRFEPSAVMPEQPRTVIVTRKLRCIRVQPVFPTIRYTENDNAGLLTYQATYIGMPLRVQEICAGKRLDPANPVCPHRGIWLGSMPVDRENRVVCPAHGLCFHRYTGEMVDRYTDCSPENREQLSTGMGKFAGTECARKAMVL